MKSGAHAHQLNRLLLIKNEKMALSPSNVSLLLCASFTEARRKYIHEHELWVNLSGKFSGGVSIPMLGMKVQCAGDLDLMLRCMEDEFVFSRANDISSPEMSGTYQLTMSEFWVIGCYEYMRVIRDRETKARNAGIENKKFSENPEFQSLSLDLELLRMPMEKHEIAKDKSMKAPIQLQRFPPNGNAADLYTYDKSDPFRAHIMITGWVENTGSITWQVLGRGLISAQPNSD